MTTDFKVLSKECPTVEFELGQTLAIYRIDSKSGVVELLLIPKSKRDQMCQKREHLTGPEILNLPKKWQPMPAQKPDSLIQLSLRHLPGNDAFAQGFTMRNGTAVAGLKFKEQSACKKLDSLIINTTLINTDTPLPYSAEHQLVWAIGDPFVTLTTTFTNLSDETITLDMLSSFSLAGVTPFAPDNAVGRMQLHRLRSIWSAEGRLDSQPVEDLQLEPSWTAHAPNSERFGQMGSMPVRRFFPWVGLEDTQEGVLWGAQLAIASSWQIEAYRRGDDICLSGGIADREFGHWSKDITSGKSFTTPTAIVATVVGDVDDLGHALTQSMVKAANNQPEIEQDLPIVFNEWCTSWGNPTHENMLANADKLADTHTQILVIDAGWAERPGDGAQENGDWNVNTKTFPQGLKGICDAIREKGMTPGIWYEWEICTDGTQAYEMTDMHLQRDGSVLKIGPRHFWDMRDPRCNEHLGKKVIDQLRKAGMGYLKVDYNDCLGIGVDGAESLGEGLRQHIVGVQDFFRRMRTELPDLVIENCSSGGHRLEPSMMEICAQGSFSDAHETVEIPIIAANLHRAILPRQNQVWCVLHQADDEKRIQYSLTATFLGRMCLSGDIHELEDWQMDIIKESQEAYQQAKSIIKSGQSRIYRDMGLSYRNPTGYQAITRLSDDGNSMLVVAHRFDFKANATGNVTLPQGKWTIKTSFGDENLLSVDGNQLAINTSPEFCGQVLILEKA